MAPIRIGIIGLNAKSGWALNAHLPYLTKSNKYKITALLNSSVDSAKASIKAHSLPSDVAAYGSPEDLAKDPNVDLVVCTVRVDRHLETLRPSVKAGKQVFSEWPLGKSLQDAEELARLAKESGSKTVVGLQIVPAPISKKLKEIISSGKIGKVFSSTLTGALYNGGPQISEPVVYLSGRDVGGNLLTIHWLHAMSGVIEVLGDLASYTTIIETKRPIIEVTDKGIDDPSRKVLRTINATSPDQILIQGHFKSGALFSSHLRGGKPFAPGQGLLWRISGEKGELSVTASSSMLQTGPPDVKLELKLNDEKPNEVPLDTDDWSELPPPAQNVARLYEAFADGRKDDYYDWETAVVMHRLIDEIYQREKNGQQDVATSYASL